MTSNTPRELYEKKLITEDQFQRIDAVNSGKIVSVFYELRILLYLGVMMFTSGIGILIYQNIGDLGHLISIFLLTVLMMVAFWYVIRHDNDYSNDLVKAPNAYFDYILLLACLLFVSIQGYIQYQYALFTDVMEWNTLVSAIFFFYVAYRYDHLGVLSLAITAFASFWGLKVSPQKWYSADFIENSDLHLTAIVFAVGLATVSSILNNYAIKKHFTFTYLNFCFLIFFTGALSGLFIQPDYDLIFVVMIYAGCGFGWVQAQRNKSFLFLLYSFVAGYIATSYLLGKYLFNQEPALWYYYFIISCGGIIYLIIHNKKIFKR